MQGGLCCCLAALCPFSFVSAGRRLLRRQLQCASRASCAVFNYCVCWRLWRLWIVLSVEAGPQL